MTTVVMLHGAHQLPKVWRAVSDSFPPAWGVVAPQLHGRADLEAMNSAIVHDLAQVVVQPPVIVVATGTGAIAAIEFCARHIAEGDGNSGATSGGIAGLLLAEPRIAVSAGAVRSAKLAAVLHGQGSAPRSADGKFTNASYAQRLSYMQALQGVSIPQGVLAQEGVSLLQRVQQLNAAGLPVRILAAEKDRHGRAGARELHKLMPQAQFFEIAQAEADWNAYAPRNFAANVAEFIATL